MPFLFQHRIYRGDLQNNPKALYVFGDNLDRVGNGGQAAEMRGEPNAFGIPTKRTPGHGSDTDYFSDDAEDLDNILKMFSAHFNALYHLLDVGNIVVFPSDGIGTGLSELPARAPKLDRLIKECVLLLDVEFGLK